MDVNGDGTLDLLSGCYSEHQPDMAGLFWVLYGRKDGKFEKPQSLAGTDGEPLILPAEPGQENVIDKICTRPFACDVDGDGKLDIVSGNFRGTFGLFKGEGGGRFQPQATWLDAGGARMAVGYHGDPCLVDWDGDGDLDLLSGSAAGGVFIFVNAGTKTAPRFSARQTLVPPAGDGESEQRFGDAHCVAPAGDTRVWAADVDGNGTLDLLVGDSITLYYAAEGVDEAVARAKDAQWQEKRQALTQAYPKDGDQAAMQKWQDDYRSLQAERMAFVREEMTGFVWLYRRK